MHLILILLAILVYWRLSTKQHQNYFEIHFIMMKNTTNILKYPLNKRYGPMIFVLQQERLENYTQFDKIVQRAFSQFFLGFQGDEEILVMKSIEGFKYQKLQKELKYIIIDRCYFKLEQEIQFRIYYIYWKAQFTKDKMIQALNQVHRCQDAQYYNKGRFRLYLIDLCLGQFNNSTKRHNTRVGTRYHKILIKYQIEFLNQLTSMMLQKYFFLKGNNNYYELDKTVATFGIEDLLKYQEKFDTPKAFKIFINTEDFIYLKKQPYNLIRKLLIYNHKSRLLQLKL